MQHLTPKARKLYKALYWEALQISQNGILFKKCLKKSEEGKTNYEKLGMGVILKIKLSILSPNVNNYLKCQCSKCSHY